MTDIPTTTLAEPKAEEVDAAFACETRIMNAWPAIDTRPLDGWLMRSANGYSKRANSVTAITAGAKLSEDQITRIISYYQGLGLPAVVRLSPLSHPSVDAMLAARGFSSFELTLGLVAPIDARITPDARVNFASKAERDWLVANATSYGSDKANYDHLEAIVSRILQPAAFASLTMDGKACAWGIGVAERGYLCLQDIVVAPQARGAGLGRTLVRSLMHWGLSNGAKTAFLQVRDTNDVAIRLYRSLGFQEAYRYTHRIL